MGRRRGPAGRLGHASCAGPGPPRSPPAPGTTPRPPGPYGVGWTAFPAFPAISGGPRQEHGLAALDDKVYVVGGIHPAPDGAFVTTGRIEVYDTRTGTWTTAAPLPAGTERGSAAVAVSGTIHLPGGGTAGGATWRAPMEH
ncbi:kelch repeat-containing protein [Actinomycetota bacterium Odt1-20B]